MGFKNQTVELNYVSNIDEEKEKVKELISLLERANELIQSLKPIDIELQA